MSTEEKLDELFYSLGRTKKVEFIDKYIDRFKKVAQMGDFSLIKTLKYQYFRN